MLNRNTIASEVQRMVTAYREELGPKEEQLAEAIYCSQVPSNGKSVPFEQQVYNLDRYLEQLLRMEEGEER